MGAIEKAQTSTFGWDLVNDLSALPDNEDKIIDYLLRRVERGQVYTWVGALLLALNPDNIVLSDQCNSSNVELENVNQKGDIPDINAIASRAYYRLIQGLGKSCQTIIISGDSGTGKTFNANKALNFLATINDVTSTAKRSPVQDLVRKITSACPLLSAFSTATTEKNLRSSRHGQLIKLEYNNGAVCGATIKSFLLERSRVTMGFDNFHIFYQLLAGLTENELQNLKLSKHSVYNLISSNKKAHNIDFSTNFEETVEAMSDLGFTVQERNDIFQAVAFLLHLGNIKFKQNYLGGCTINTEDEASKQALRHICSIMSITEPKLVQFLTTSLISSNKDNEKNRTIDRCEIRTAEMCYHRLHSIIRHIYDLIFQQLINRVNAILSSGFECKTWLGILDIFGFEIFSENKIEQLCINYANERLQLYFMQDYLDSTRNDMMEEGFIDFIEAQQTQIHKDRLAVIEGHLFPVLIDATQCSAQFNENTLRQRLLDSSTSKFLSLPRNHQHFVIQHYSNPVEYTFDNFVSKNIDKVPPELSMIFENTENEFFYSLKDSIQNEKNKVNGKIIAKKCTTLAKVRQSLDMLVKELNKCDSHYVRCVKPCFKNGIWLKDDFKRQLKCIGVFDALNLAKCKYPVRTGYQEFMRRYRFKKQDQRDVTEICKSLSEEILGTEKVAKSIHFGTKLIFMTEPAFLQLENFRKKYRCLSARKIQMFWKKRRKNKIINKNGNAKNHFELSRSINYVYPRKVKSTENLSTIVPNENQKSRKNSINDIRNQRNLELNKLRSPNFVPWNQKSSLLSNKKPELNKVQTSDKRKFKTYNKSNEDDITKLIFYYGSAFYYKSRILSRQRLAEVPVRFHTRRTCLEESHRLPKSELPRGLVDCL